jgi:hypothetical protein
LARKPVKKPVKRAVRPKGQAPRRMIAPSSKAVAPRKTVAKRATARATRKPRVRSAPAPKPQRGVVVTPPPPEPERRLPPVPPRPGIRLAGSASSRLTIKPGPPQGLRAPLELSTRPRPSGPRKLSEVDLEEDEVLIDGFEAVLEGEKVKVTAVLERTCVYVDRGGDRRLARKNDLWVEADKLPIRRRGLA